MAAAPATLLAGGGALERFASRPGVPAHVPRDFVATHREADEGSLFDVRRLDHGDELVGHRVVAV